MPDAEATSPGSVNPIWAGLRCRCPRCGVGPVFDGYLRLTSECPECGADWSSADCGDGPAVFVVFAVGAIVVPFALVLLLMGAPAWLGFAAPAALAIGLSAALLRLFRATLVALQHHHAAHEARLDS